MDNKMFMVHMLNHVLRA